MCIRDRYTADTIAVTSGLTAGDEVITTWSAGLKDGAPIRLAGQEEADLSLIHI